MNDTAGLRRQLAVERAEMAALWRTEAPDQARIIAKQKESWALREQIQKQAASYRNQVGTIAPEGSGPCLAFLAMQTVRTVLWWRYRPFSLRLLSS